MPVEAEVEVHTCRHVPSSSVCSSPSLHSQRLFVRVLYVNLVTKSFIPRPALPFDPAQGTPSNVR